MKKESGYGSIFKCKILLDKSETEILLFWDHHVFLGLFTPAFAQYAGIHAVGAVQAPPGTGIRVNFQNPRGDGVNTAWETVCSYPHPGFEFSITSMMGVESTQVINSNSFWF